MQIDEQLADIMTKWKTTDTDLQNITQQTKDQVTRIHTKN